MTSIQEEMDWRCYGAYGLLPEGATSAHFVSADPPELQFGERTFEIVLARRVAEGDETTNWFELHGKAPITEPPSHWTAHYRTVVERRIYLI